MTILGRFSKGLKKKCIRPRCHLSLEEARRLVADFVLYYNTCRLHSALGYITPKDKLEGREDEVFTARDRKIEEAREQRKAQRQRAVAAGKSAR